MWKAFKIMCSVGIVLICYLFCLVLVGIQCSQYGENPTSLNHIFLFISLVVLLITASFFAKFTERPNLDDLIALEDEINSKK